MIIATSSSPRVSKNSSRRRRDQVFRLADRVCALRRGAQVGILRTRATSGDPRRRSICAEVADATMTIGRVQVHRWPATDAARLIVLVHGYGEHMAWYEHLAQAFVTRGSAVVGPATSGTGSRRARGRSWRTSRWSSTTTCAQTIESVASFAERVTAS